MVWQWESLLNDGGFLKALLAIIKLGFMFNILPIMIQSHRTLSFWNLYNHNSSYFCRKIYFTYTSDKGGTNGIKSKKLLVVLITRPVDLNGKVQAFIKNKIVSGASSIFYLFFQFNGHTWHSFIFILIEFHWYWRLKQEPEFLCL